MLRILVVDDEQCIRDTFKWFLEDLGHDVVASPNPLQCSVYNGHHCDKDCACFDVLLTDYNMPIMNGLELVEHMFERGCKLAAKNKFIMSGDTSAIDMDKAKTLGCHVLEKPITFSELECIIHEIENDYGCQ